MSGPDRRASDHLGRNASTRQVEPDLRLVRGRSPVPGVCASFTGALLAGALLVGGVATVSGVAGVASASCDVGASQARLAGARHLVTTLRLSHTSDARRIALAGDLQSMGLTPAISTGWRQQAVDVSDRLVGTTDPALNRVAITLARSGVGPTPADLVHSPGTVQELLNTADQPLDGLSNAVTAAGVAAGSLSATPRASVPRTTSGTPPAGGGRAPRPRIEPPRACSDPGDETGPAAPGTATGTTTATAGPDSSATDPTSTSSVPDGSPPATATGDSDTFETAPTMTSEPDPADPTNPVPDSTDPRTSAPDMSTDGPVAPDTSNDLRDAADAVQAVADLLRSLSNESTPDAQRLADQIRDLLPQLRVPDPADSRNPDPAAPQRSDTPETPTTTWPSTVRTAAPTDPATGDETADPSPSDPTSSADEPGGDWESQARQLADQAQQAAGTDPLARELVTKLDAAGFGDGAEPGTDELETGTASSDPTTPPSADPTGTSSATATRDQSSSAPPSSSATSDMDSEFEPPTDGDVSPATWDRLAQCESSGDWAADTGNGYAGGLQFAPATWQAFGGQGSPSDASRSEQIAVAQQVKDAQGWSAWLACSTKLGLR